MNNIPNISDFCDDCGNLVDLPIYSNEIECQICKFKKSALGTFKNKLNVIRVLKRGDCDKKGV